MNEFLPISCQGDNNTSVKTFDKGEGQGGDNRLLYPCLHLHNIYRWYIKFYNNKQSTADKMPKDAETEDVIKWKIMVQSFRGGVQLKL